MDALFPLLFMAIVYIVPKIFSKLVETFWKSYSLKNNKNQENAAQSVELSLEANEVNNEKLTASNDSAAHHPDAVPNVSNLTNLEDKTAWQDKMDAKAVINGVIFAEIVQPPRAYRPFVRRK